MSMIEEENYENETLLLNYTTHTDRHLGEEGNYHGGLRRKQTRMMFETTESAGATKRWDTQGNGGY